MNHLPLILKEIKIEVTHDCNLECLHCSSVAGCDNFLQMEWEDCKRILGQAWAMNVEEVAFSGGEPLLWPHLNNAINYAKQLGLHTSVYSTGFIEDIESVLQKLKESSMDKIVFSMYAGRSNIHDSITTINGSFESTIKAIKTAIRLGIRAELHFVPMKTNFSELPNVTQLATELEIDKVSILRLVPQGRGGTGNLALDKKETAELREMVSALREMGTNIRLGSPYSILCFPDSPLCGAAINKMTISPALFIAPCDAFKQITAASLGIDDDFDNLHTCSLEEAWEKSEYFNEVRKYIFSTAGQTCEDCASFPMCNSGCVAQKVHQTGTLSKMPDPLCMRQPQLYVA